MRAVVPFCVSIPSLVSNPRNKWKWNVDADAGSGSTDRSWKRDSSRLRTIMLIANHPKVISFLPL